MRNFVGWVTVSLVGLALAAGLASAHARNYATVDRFSVGAMEVGLRTCVDDRFTAAGQGGTVGAVLNTLGGTADPVAPDIPGSCYRPNHILPNANGDVTLGAMDELNANLSLCAGQDTDGDNSVCDDVGDIQIRFCNSVTVNRDIDPAGGFPIFRANAWRFQDSQGVPALDTWVTTRFISGVALLGPIFPACGEGVDAFATIGTTSHS